jgi:hypothetical protein
MNCLNYDDGALKAGSIYRVELMALTEICYLPGPVSSKEPAGFYIVTYNGNMADDPNVRRVVGPFRSLKAACKFVEKRNGKRNKGGG